VYKAIDKWLLNYLTRKRKAPPRDSPVDILLCVCDHFEPFHATDKAGALSRMRAWNESFPKLIQAFRDADGVPPRHTFFYPIEQYDRDVIDELERLTDACGGEVEIHLHHDNDTPDGLRAAIDQGVANFRRHGFLSRDPRGDIRFAFIHGDWALDNSHPTGRHCGVPDELRILRESGCYVDMTLPSAPSPTQTKTINSVYYAKSSKSPKSHDTGRPVRVKKSAASPLRDDTSNLLLIQGPLGLNWERRKLGVLPRIENGDLTGANPPTMDRARLWLRLHNHVAGRPDVVFVKLHTHGAIERNSEVFLGEPYKRFHEQLLGSFNDQRGRRIHYVTAREMTNILHAMEDGRTGPPGDYRDYHFKLAGKP
jgi:hypothetical protein